MMERKVNMLLVTFLICIFIVSLLFVHKSPAEVPAKFTERARIIINYANEEAIRLNHDKIDTEHLLLGLVHEGQGIAARALEELGVSLERLETSIKSMIKEKGGKAKLPTQSLAFTRAANKVLQYAMEEAQKLEYDQVATEHILLGLVREEEGVANQVLHNLGLTQEKIYETVLNLLGAGAFQPAPETVKSKKNSKPDGICCSRPKLGFYFTMTCGKK